MTADMQAAVQRLLDERERQGLPLHVTDPGALAAVAAVLVSSRAEAAA